MTRADKPDDVRLDHAPRRRADVTSVELDGEAVLYRQGGMHRLDTIGTLLWNCLDGQATLREIVESLCGAYDADAEIIERDVLDFAQLMADEGLLEGVEGGGRAAPSS